MGGGGATRGAQRACIEQSNAASAQQPVVHNKSEPTCNRACHSLHDQALRPTGQQEAIQSASQHSTGEHSTAQHSLHHKVLLPKVLQRVVQPQGALRLALSQLADDACSLLRQGHSGRSGHSGDRQQACGNW